MANMVKKENGNQPSTFGSVVDQIFQNNLSRFFDDSFWGFNGFTGRQQVPVNIRETDKTYEMELVAPGLQKDAFKLQLSGDTLTVSFEDKKDSHEQQQGNWITREFRLQSFSRTFTLDDSVDAENITARYDGGVLYLTIPKKEHAQKVSKTINIQ